jgi:hypothetical protein
VARGGVEDVRRDRLPRARLAAAGFLRDAGRGRPGLRRRGGGGIHDGSLARGS